MEEDTQTKGALIFVIILFVVLICFLVFSGVSYFGNLSFGYKLPVVGTIPNIQSATLPKLEFHYHRDPSSEEPTSSDEPSSYEPSSFEVPPSDQSQLIGLYQNEKRNMNPFGNYKIVTDLRKHEAKEIDNILQRLNNAANSAIILNKK